MMTNQQKFSLIALICLSCLSWPVFSGPQAVSGDYKTWYDRGSEFLEQDELEQAIEAFQTALRSKPGSIEALLGLAEAYSFLENWNKTIETYEKALKIKPDDYLVLSRYLRALEDAGKEGPQLKVLKSLFTLNQSDMVLGLKYLKKLEDRGIENNLDDYGGLVEKLGADPNAPPAIKEKLTWVRNLKQSIVKIQKAIQDSVARVEKIRKDSLARLEKAIQDSIAKVDKARKDSLARAEKARRDSIAEVEKFARLEQARKDSAARVEKARKDSIARVEKARRDSIARVKKAREDSIARVEKARRDSIARAEKTRKDSIARVEKARKDSIARAEKARKDSIAKAEKAMLEQARRDSIARVEAEKKRKAAAEKAFWKKISSVIKGKKIKLDTSAFLKEINKRVSKEPEQQQLLEAGGILYFKRGKYDKSVNFLKQLKQMNFNSNRRLALGHYQLKQYQQSLLYFKKLDRKRIRVSDWKRQCQALVKLDKRNKAMEEYEALLKRHPGSEDVLIVLIKHYRDPLQKKELAAKLEQFIKKRPEDHAALLELAGLFDDDHPKARKYRWKYLHLKPNDHKAARELAMLYEKNGEQKKALDLYLKYHEQFSGDFKYNVKLGRLLHNSKKLNKALLFYERARELKPTDSTLTVTLTDAYRAQGKPGKAAVVWKEYGRLSLKQGKKARARAALQNALDLGYKGIKLKFHLAGLYLEVNQTTRAEALLKNVIAEKEDFHEAHFLLAKTCMKNNQSGIAIDHMLQALKYAPENVNYSEFLGGIFYSSDELKETVKALGPVKAKLSSKYREIYADCLSRLGQKETAIKQYARNYKAQASSPTAVSQLADLYIRKNRPDSAIGIISKSEYKKSPKVKIILAKAHLFQGDLDKAKEILKTVPQQERDNAEFFFVSGLRQYKLGDFSDAEDEFNRGLVFDVQNPEIKYMIGICRTELGKLEKAKDIFHELRKFQDTLWQSRGYLGLALVFEKEKKNEAVEHHLLKSLEMKWYPEVILRLVRYYLKIGKTNKAQKWARKMKENSRVGPWAQAARTEVLLKLGKTDQAVELIQTALKKHPFSCDLLLVSAKSGLARKDHNHAKIASEGAISRCPERPMGYLLLGTALVKAGDKKGAAKQFKKFKKFGGDASLIPK
ncbi:tetratricopeptide repeat protein [Fibrobacterota bacterium]